MTLAVMRAGDTGTLFERCGGFRAVRAVIMDFYERVLDSDIVGHHFDGVDMARLVDHQTKFVSALAGGPVSINDARLARAHAALAVTHAEFDEIGRLLARSLEAARLLQARPRRDPHRRRSAPQPHRATGASVMMDLISTELLKAIGAGVALADAASDVITFVNPAFAEWFGEDAKGAKLADIVPGFAAVAADIEEDGAASFEASVKRRRRELVIAITVRSAVCDGRDVLVVEAQNVSRLRQTEAMIDTYAAMSEHRTRELEREKAQVEKLLLNLMPRSVYEEYKTFGSVTPKLFEPVSVLMLDFVGFTEIAQSADPTVLVAELNDIFTAFDRIAETEGCERIKTIGDAYLAVAGLPQPNPDHGRAAAKCAVKMLRYLERRNATHRQEWKARIGIASGSVVGSVVGVQKYVYDVFGCAVNRAARLQTLCDPMQITVGEELFGEVIDEFHLSASRVETLRGIGDMRVARLSERRTSPVDRLMVA